MNFEWFWCNLCEAATMHCPQCGNNLCNGHYECLFCEFVDAYIDREYAHDRYPKTEDEVLRYNFELAQKYKNFRS